jgi:NAD+ synthase
MINDLLNLNSVAETQRIASFIKTTLKKQGFKNVAIGFSGGIDSTVSLTLAGQSISPRNIFVAHLYYFKSQVNFLKPLLKKINIPQKNIYNVSIKDIVDEIQKELGLTKNSKNYRLRLGNIMARVRMIILYDLAKKHSALVCGTENKSEFYLGYFTRFGDEASDLEPIRHLYKTQIYQLAKHLNIPKKIIDLPPTAGLWTDQADETDFGFSYREADRVLSLYLDRKKSFPEIIKMGLPNAKKIIYRVNKNSFKHLSPHVIDNTP